MFHANTDSEVKDFILKDLTSCDGDIKVLISTVAFGMGVNVADIDMIVHWGLPRTSMNYWQEVGRCARDGRHGYAICYAYKRSVTKSEDNLKKALSSECIRACILQQFQLIGMSTHELDIISSTLPCDGHCAPVCDCKNCRCCFNCQLRCKCANNNFKPLETFLYSN